MNSIKLTGEQLKTYSKLENSDHFREALNKILIPRVVGTKGHKQVREYLIDSLEDLGWTIERDPFIDEVPILGVLNFENVVAMLNPEAERFLVLACHYDSKYMAKIEFVGATDSAVPCAMLINLAHVLQDELNKIKNQKLSLMFVFFDGEEAFENWSSQDSIYGARHLAKRWARLGLLNRVDMMVLLDLLGAPDPQFYSFWGNTEPWYAKMMAIEQHLSKNDMLKKYTSSGVSRSKPNRYFQPNSLRSNYVEDDHVPFQKLGIPIIHLIPMPFPHVWHTEKDNLDIVDFNTVYNLNQIMRLFVLEYLLA